MTGTWMGTWWAIPVTANDANNDRLTYSLEMRPTVALQAEADVFQIDRETGQVTVGLGKKVSPIEDDQDTVARDPGDRAWSPAGMTFTVTIKATDPGGVVRHHGRS